MKHPKPSHRAFTIVELLVIVAVLAIFGTLLLPAFAKSSKTQASGLLCLDNHAQLIKAWTMYTADADDYVANNYTIPGTQLAINKWKTNTICETWGPNVITWSSTGADANSTTNTTLAQSGLLAPYHQRDIEFYHCPSDNYLSRAQKAAGWKRRLRSVGMNSNWGRSDPAEPKNGIATSWAYGAPFRQWHRLAEVRKPAERFVFVDEHADSINDGFFLIPFGGGGGTGEYPRTVPGAAWGDIPGFYHNKATPFAFSDGHTEMRKWFSRPVPVRADTSFPSVPADIRDQEWYVQHVAERL